MLSVMVLLFWSLCFAVPHAAAQSESELERSVKKEGRVVFWSSMRIEDSRALAAGFEAKYSYIKVDIFRAASRSTRRFLRMQST